MQLSAYLPKGSYRVYKLHQLVPVWIFSFNGRCEIFILGQPRNPPWLHLGTPLDFQDSWKTDLQLVHRMNTCELLVGKGGCGWCEEILEVICNEPINIWSNRCFEAQILFFPQNLGKLYLLWKIEIKENELIMAMQSLLSFLSKFHGESQQKSVEKYMHIVATKNIKVCANCDFWTRGNTGSLT